jgi:hypothetical protein
MMAKSVLKEPGGYQTSVANQTLPPVRVILSAPAEAAQPPQQAQLQASSPPEPVTAKQVQAPSEKQDTRRAEAEEQERNRRSANARRGAN